MAQCWLDSVLGTTPKSLNPELFQVPEEEGLAEWFESGIAARVRDADAEGHRLVAEANGHVVGFLGASVAKPLENAHREVMREGLSHARLTIYVLAVAEAYRRQGMTEVAHGKLPLMAAAEEWAHGRGAVLATTDTYVGSYLSVPFYRNRIRCNIQSLLCTS